MSYIKLDYTEVMAESRKLTDIANDAEQYLKELKNISLSIPSFWTGEASKAFINLCIQEEREFNELINTINTISGNLKTVADEIKAADDKSKNLIDNTFGGNRNYSPVPTIPTDKKSPNTSANTSMNPKHHK